MNNKVLVSSIATTTLIVTGMLLTKPTYAFWPFDSLTQSSNQNATTTTTPPSLMDKIIEKFGLNKEEVQTVVNTYRTERQQEMQAKFEANLTTAVKNGELTEAQKQLILTKHAELMKANEADFQNRQARRTELQTWATQNGIDLKYFGQGRHAGYGKGSGMGRGMGQGMGQGMGRGMMEFDSQ